MAERASPLARIELAAAGGAVTLRQLHFASILQVSAWPNTVQTVNAVIRELTGIDVPALGTASSGADIRLAATAPGRTLVAAHAPDLVVRFEAALPSSEGTVTELSHGRVLLALEGEPVTALLAKVMAIDLEPSVFPVGRVAQTTIDHVDVVVHRLTLTAFELWTFRSFSQAAVEWLLDAGLEIGVTFTR